MLKLCKFCDKEEEEWGEITCFGCDAIKGKCHDICYWCAERWDRSTHQDHHDNYNVDYCIVCDPKFYCNDRTIFFLEDVSDGWLKIFNSYKDDNVLVVKYPLNDFIKHIQRIEQRYQYLDDKDIEHGKCLSYVHENKYKIMTNNDFIDFLILDDDVFHFFRDLWDCVCVFTLMKIETCVFDKYYDVEIIIHYYTDTNPKMMNDKICGRVYNIKEKAFELAEDIAMKNPKGRTQFISRIQINKI
jgi:hypothetical protein